ncbi:hypothetical protein IWQ61_010239, partial [Dispira simplex]
MVSDIKDVSFHSATTSDLDPEMEVDKTWKEDEILIEAHNWLSSNMSINLFCYQLSDQALWKTSQTGKKQESPLPTQLAKKRVTCPNHNLPPEEELAYMVR